MVTITSSNGHHHIPTNRNMATITSGITKIWSPSHPDFKEHGHHHNLNNKNMVTITCELQEYGYNHIWYYKNNIYHNILNYKNMVTITSKMPKNVITITNGITRI